MSLPNVYVDTKYLRKCSYVLIDSDRKVKGNTVKNVIFYYCKSNLFDYVV